MKALILNSGLGSRLGVLTHEKPKCMVDIGGGYTILSRQLTQLAEAGVREAVITTGAFADRLRAHVAELGLPIHVQYAHNPDYRTTNYIVSILNAAPLLKNEDVVLLHGDLVLETGVLAELLASERNVMAVDGSLPLPEKDFKARLSNGKIIAVGVGLFGADCVACQPAYRFGAEAFARWLKEMATFVERGETGVYAENAFNALDGAVPLYPLELHGRLCAEIDNPDDLVAVGARFIRTLNGRK
ncbi:MAG: NTP transferase domain-containing protein [Eubacteriales bacterium]|nr:NTP transferase domain-containing protein [Eubacteriales bacterium]